MLMEAVVAIGIPAVALPPGVLQKLLQHTLAEPTLLSPGHVRGTALSNPQRVRVACQSRLHLSAALLGYCLADVDNSRPLDLVQQFPVKADLTLSRPVQECKRKDYSVSLCCAQRNV